MAKRLTTRLSAGAALVTGLGMVGIAAATPAQADVTTTLAYTCDLTNPDLPAFKDPWTVDLTVGVEEQYDQGATIPAPAIKAEVTPGDDAKGNLKALGVKTLEGTASTKYSFGDTERTADLTVPVTDVAADGSVTTVASGTGTEETAPAEDTTIPITAGDFTAALTTDSGFGLNLECTAPEDNAVGDVTIGEATEEPGDGTEEPGDGTEEPGDGTEEPGDGTEEPGDGTEEPGDGTEEPVEVNDWFNEPSSLPLVDNTFTVEGDATQAGTITVQVLSGVDGAPGEVLKTYTMDATEGANKADFDLVEGADYVRLLSQDCVDAQGRSEEEAGGCNVTYKAPWADDGDNGSGDAGDDSGEQVSDEAPAEPEAPAADAPAQPEVPAVVQTDGLTPVAPQEDNTAALALGGLLLAGAGAGTILVARRRAAAQH